MGGNTLETLVDDVYTLMQNKNSAQGVDTEAYEIIQESAFSAGYMLFTTRDGSIGWTFIGDALPQPVSATSRYT